MTNKTNNKTKTKKLKKNKKNNTQKNPWRPSKYKKELDDLIYQSLSKGFSLDAAAAECDITKETVYQWAGIGQYSESKYIKESFSDAVHMGRQKGIAFWEKIGMAGITGKIRGFKERSYNFTMKNKAGWSDKVESKISGQVININIDKEDEEL